MHNIIYTYIKQKVDKQSAKQDKISEYIINQIRA